MKVTEVNLQHFKAVSEGGDREGASTKQRTFDRRRHDFRIARRKL